MIKANEQLYRQRLMRGLTRYFTPGLEVLDAGCGPGVMAEVLAGLGCRVTALDIEPHPEAWAARTPLGIKFLTGSAEALPFKDAVYDLVWAQDAFHHMNQPEIALKECWRVLKPGGKLIMAEANRHNPLFYVHMTLLKQHEHFSRRRFKQLIEGLHQPALLSMVETRCLPWDHKLILALFNRAADLIERVKWFKPWLTYQLAVINKPGQDEEKAGAS